MTGSFESFERLAVALAIGFLIGIDRERAELRKARGLFAGVRTFPLVALAGAVPTLLAPALGAWIVIASFAGVAAIAAIAYVRSSVEDAGATTEIAALTTFWLAALAGSGEILVSVAGGITVALLLAAKPRLERFSRALREEELWAALELAVLSGIVLPLLPNRGLGPWGVLNPFDVWLVVVLVSAVSFAGFVAVRLVGDRAGLLATGVFGALASSTAVTAAMASRTRAEGGRSGVEAAAAVLASAVMCVRVALFVAAFGPGLLPALLPTIGAMSLVGSVAGLALARADRRPGTPHPVSNPFQIRTALVFGAIYAATLVALRAARELFGPSGTLAAAVLSSLADVDAVSIAFARAGPGAAGWRDAALAVSLALVANTLSKGVVAVALGAGRFRVQVAASLAAMALAGLAAGLLLGP